MNATQNIISTLEKDFPNDNEVDISSEEIDDDESESDAFTKSMLEEEEKLHEENLQRDLKETVLPEILHITAEERLERLTILLEKSKVYADFLLKVVVKKKEEEKRKTDKRLALQKKKLASRQRGENSSAQNSPTIQGSGRKRQREPEEESQSMKRPRKKGKKAEKKVIKDTLPESLAKVLETHLYLPSSDDVIVSQVTENNGIRYFGDQIVNPVQPQLFTGGVLRDYQIVGYQWLKVLFENAVNGILADEMGLGKTIQCIALICRLVQLGFKGPFIVCAPVSTIPNWVSEFKTFAPEVPLLLYHGSAEERCFLAKYITAVSDRLQCHPVVVTSYEILMRDRAMLARHNWEYLILDEGHRIKNTNCRLVKELRMLQTNTKLLLTGTPLQNNLAELWSLLNFIIPEVFDDLQVFESWFKFTDKKSNGAADFSLEQEEKFLSALYEILTPFLLRRVKSDVAIDLPPKSEVVVYAPFSPKQESFYRAAVNKTLRKLVTGEDMHTISAPPCGDITNSCHTTRSTTAEARLKSDFASYWKDDDKDVNISLNNIMMLLRKCCNHPYLIEYPLIPGTDYFKVDEELVLASGKLMILDRILPKLRERGHKVLLFSQMTKMLDILEDYLRLRKCTSVRLDGSTKVEVRHALIKRYNSDADLFVFLLSTRAGGLGINLTAADTVIIYDSDWNPQNDLQAQDRCHRIGQTRPVMVYRLVTASSIDQQMVERAATKRKLEKMVMHKQKFKGRLDVELKQKTKIGQSEILHMLQSSDYEHVVDSTEGTMTESELEKLLDRSSLQKQG